MEDKKGIIVICILSVVLVICLIGGTIKDKRAESVNRREYNEWLNSKKKEKNDNKVQDNDEKEEDVKSNFYEKLNNKQKVRVLVLGDGIAQSQGRNSNNGIWTEGVKWLLNSKYGSEVDLVSLAKARTTSEAGYQITVNNDISNFDLIIICYGYNDNSSNVEINSFKESYINMIDQIKTKSPNGTIMPVLISSLKEDNAYRNEIINIAQSYQLTCADMQKKFKTVGLSEGKISNNGIPNDLGYQYYTETIGEIIANNINS